MSKAISLVILAFLGCTVTAQDFAADGASGFKRWQKVGAIQLASDLPTITQLRDSRFDKKSASAAAEAKSGHVSWTAIQMTGKWMVTRY